MVAPVTTVIRGLPSEVPLGKDFGLEGPAAVNLDAVMTVSRLRLGDLAGRLGWEELNEVCAALQVAIGCDVGDCGGGWASSWSAADRRTGTPRAAGRDGVTPTAEKRGDGLERRPPVGTRWPEASARRVARCPGGATPHPAFVLKQHCATRPALRGGAGPHRENCPEVSGPQGSS